jgi:hypothetical protein
MRAFVPVALLCLAGASGCAQAVRAPDVGATQHSQRVRESLRDSHRAKLAAQGPVEDDMQARGAVVRDPTRLARLPFQIDPPDEKAGVAEVERLRPGNLQKWNWMPTGQDARWGHAEVLVNASLEAVRAQVTDYGHINEFAPSKFKSARIVDKRPGTTDVYVQIPLLHGLVTLWQVVRFAPPQVLAPGFEVVQGGLVKGNVKRMSILLTMRSVDASRTVLACDMSLELEFFAPQSAIDEELRDAAGEAVASVKARAEQAKLASAPQSGG